MYGINLTSEKLSIEHSKVTKCVIMSLLLLLFQYYTFAGLWYVTYHFCGKTRQMIIFILLKGQVSSRALWFYLTL